jgi:hypothetical protein
MFVLVDKKGKFSVVEGTDISFATYGKLKCIWNLKGKTVHLYGRTKKTHRPIVKYDFPPPVDIKTFYGECLLVNPHGSLSIQEWETMYEELMGGFEDINSESDVSKDEDTGVPKTRHGYELDGFVVNSDEENM